MSYSMPLWEYLGKLAKAKLAPEATPPFKGEDYFTERKQEWPPEPTGLDRLRGGTRRNP